MLSMAILFPFLFPCWYDSLVRKHKDSLEHHGNAGKMHLLWCVHVYSMLNNNNHGEVGLGCVMLRACLSSQWGYSFSGSDGCRPPPPMEGIEFLAVSCRPPLHPTWCIVGLLRSPHTPYLQILYGCAAPTSPMRGCL
jgi:hypothetical protein